MERWSLDTQHSQPILTHYCDEANDGDDNKSLRQDLGGGYFRCDRCGEKFLPPQEPGNPRYVLHYKHTLEAPIA